MIPPQVPSFLTCEEVAQILRVTPATVRNMIRDGKINAIQPSGMRGSYRIPSSALDTLLGNEPSQPSVETRSSFCLTV